MSVPDYKINYKSDFVLTINGDAGWAVPFCIKFWTGMPSQAYFVGFDGVKYVNCRVGDTPTQLLVMFDDHHLPIGKLEMQIAYHTTIEEFPGSVFDEVTNARDVTVTIDGTDYQVMLDFTGEDAPELEFDLPAYANEAERIQNELQRQQNEADRIAAELQREQATAAAVQGAENVNAQLNGTTLTVTNRNGVSTSVNTKGEQGAQGPVGPEGPQGEMGISIVSFLPKSETATTLIYTITYSNGHTQDVAIPKGPKGDTGATGPTGPQGPQGDTGVSITGFVETGETETATLYNITFSNGTTQQVAIPKGEKGDQGPAGPTGPQGPMGDVAVITPDQQAAFTMYSTTGQNTNGPMTQKAVTDALVAEAISYDNSQSGLTAENVQDAIDELNRVHKTESVINLSSFSVKNGFLASSNVWITPNANRVNNHICFSVQQGEWYSITAKSNSTTGYAFLNSDQIPSTNLQSIDLVSGTSVVVVPAGKTITFQVPSNCYLAINSGNVSNRDHIPSSFCQVSEPVSINEGLNEIETIIEPLTNIPFFSESANWDIINTNEIRGALLNMELLRGEVPQGAYIKYFGGRTYGSTNFTFNIYDSNGVEITRSEVGLMPSSGIVKFTTKGSCSFEVTINTANIKTIGTAFYDWASSNLILNEKYFLNKKYSLPFFARNANWNIINTNEIYGTLIDMKLIRGEVPQGAYIKYFGSRDTNPSQLTFHIYDNNNNRISSGSITNALEDGTLQTFYTNGLCTFKVTVNASKRNINTQGTFRDWGTDLLLNSEYLKVEGTPKRIVCFGDSITQFLDTEQSLTYPDYLARLSGCDVFNAGIGGTRLARRATPTATISNETQARAAVDISNLVSAWINNDWTIVDAAVTWLYNNNHSHDYRAKIAALKTIDPNEVDIVTIFGGTNDFMGDSKLGIAGSTAIDEVAGGLEVMFNLIQTANKAIEIFVFCPIVRYINNDRTSPYWSDNYTSSGTNLNGKKLPDIADFIESVSQYHHIPCRNWYWDLGWNPFNFSEYFNANDGTHPYKGMDYIGEKMYLYLKTKTKFTK